MCHDEYMGLMWDDAEKETHLQEDIVITNTVNYYDLISL